MRFIGIHRGRGSSSLFSNEHFPWNLFILYLFFSFAFQIGILSADASTLQAARRYRHENITTNQQI